MYLNEIFFQNLSIYLYGVKGKTLNPKLLRTTSKHPVVLPHGFTKKNREKEHTEQQRLQNSETDLSQTIPPT